MVFEILAVKHAVYMEINGNQDRKTKMLNNGYIS